MAVYGQGSGRQTAQPGQTAMWQSLNAALSGYEQQGFIKRSDDLREDLRKQGLLNFSGDSTDAFNAEGHINIPGGAKNLQGHYDQLYSSAGKRKIRRALGANASKDDVKAFIQESVDKRNQNVLNTIKMRLHEKGRASVDETGATSYSDIYTVIPKLNEEGGKEFNDYYESLDESSKMELMQLGYTPGIAEEKWVPEYFEKRKAQGKGNKLLAGAGIVGAGGIIAGIIAKNPGLIGRGIKAVTGGSKVAKAAAPLTVEQLTRLPARTQKLLKAYNSKGAIAQAMEAGHISGNEAKILAQQLSGKGQQAVRDWGGLTAKTGSAEQLLIGGQKPVPKIPKGADPALWRRVGKGYLPFAVGAGAGGMIGKAVGGDTGEAVGAVGGAISVPMVVKAYKDPAKRKAINAVLKKFAPKILTKLGVSALGYVGPQAAEPISTALGVAGTAWAAYDVVQLARQLPELYDAITI